MRKMIHGSTITHPAPENALIATTSRRSMITITTADIMAAVKGWVVANKPIPRKIIVIIKAKAILAPAPPDIITGRALPTKYKTAIPKRKLRVFKASVLNICTWAFLSPKILDVFCMDDGGGGGGGGGGVLMINCFGNQM